MTRRPLHLATALALTAFALGGCVSLLPKAKPAALYRFGGEESAAIATPSTTARGVTLVPIEFPREAVTDGILTVEGQETAYLAGARWAAPAPVLFRQTLGRTFDVSAPGINLLGRGEIGRVAGILDVEVLRFEAHYDSPAATPTIRVTLQARLASANGSPIAAQTFDASVPASQNGARAIVEAYNQAVGQTLTKLAGWTDQNTPQPTSVRSTSTTTSTTSSSTTTRQP